jgi:orsellinic acid C3-O-methyltransferase
VLAEQTFRLPPSVAAMRIATAYIASQAINVACQLRIPDVLGNGAATAGEIARATGAQADMMRRLLRALAAFDVLKDLEHDGFCADHRLVIAGLDPAIHLLESTLFFWMDARVKPGMTTQPNAIPL